MSNSLSELQKKYLEEIVLDVSRTHLLNVIAAIKKKFIDFDYFLIKFLAYKRAPEFEEHFKSIYDRLDIYFKQE